nr:putative reverse transcriptase domain-containing protein [Tanacetum cinerariifolium]
MPVELGSFDAIIGMDWLRRHHAMIVCDEKLVRVPFGNETLVFSGAESYIRRESRLTEDDKPKGKHVKDVPIVQDFPGVFPENLPGLAGYYQRFIEGFSKIAMSMTKLTKKAIKFDWGEKEKNAFQLIKQKLCSALILALHKGSEDFVVYCDALHKGLGAVLMQRVKVIDYASIQQRRWLEILSDYDCDIRYHPGKANVVADALSHKERDVPLWVRALVMTISLGLPKQILAALIEGLKPKNLKKEDVGVARHEIPISIMCDRDGRFTSNFWKSFQKALGTDICMSTTYHPETDGQSERIIQTLEDMLRTCVIDFGKVWVKYLPLAELSYNNNYHASIKAAPYEALYGRKCRSPMCWAEVGESQLTGLELIQETAEKIVLIKQRMQAAQDRQKNYADRKRKPMEFEIGDRVMVEVSPWKGVVRFGKQGKLNLRYVGPLKVLAKVGKVAYKLELPQELSRVHPTFHVSNLKKCYSDESLVMPLEGVHIDETLQFVEEPIEIIKQEIKRLKRSRIPLVKVRWNSRRGPEFT